MMIPENAPVRLLNAQLEELEYGKLYEAYSSKGRKSAADPRVLFKVLVHGYLCGIYSSRKLEEACQYRIDFKWLLEDGKASDHSTFARFRTGRCREAVEDLFYQFVRKLEEVGETDHKTVFIDGTKLESRAGRYSFVWRKNVEKQLARVKEKLKSMTGLSTCAAVRSMLEEEASKIAFVSGKGRRKGQAQREWETKKVLLERWERYEDMLSIMGQGRNSYAKTDTDATFMRMKEDHMRNGQLKDVAVGIAASQGNFELNVFMPVCIYNFLQSVRLLTDCIHSFNKNCVAGITADRERCMKNLHQSLMLVTVLNPYIGYENAAKTAQKAYAEQMSLKEACVSLGFLSAERFEQIFHPEGMI